MSYLQETIDIQSLFAAQWAAGENTPIEYDNSDLRNATVPFVSLMIVNGLAEQIELGKPANNYRHDGQIVVQIHCERDKDGTATALRLADAAAAIFRSQFIGTGIVCKTPAVDRVGPNGDYYQVNVITGFHRDSTF